MNTDDDLKNVTLTVKKIHNSDILFETQNGLVLSQQKQLKESLESWRNPRLNLEQARQTDMSLHRSITEGNGLFKKSTRKASQISKDETPTN